MYYVYCYFLHDPQLWRSLTFLLLQFIVILARIVNWGCHCMGDLAILQRATSHYHAAFSTRTTSDNVFTPGRTLSEGSRSCTCATTGLVGTLSAAPCTGPASPAWPPARQPRTQTIFMIRSSTVWKSVNIDRMWLWVGGGARYVKKILK
jgi:hypothetical protein